LLRRLAKEGGAAVGGSFLAQRGRDTYNTFALALPDGETVLTHDKDIPSNTTEAMNYRWGEDDGVFLTPGLTDAPLAASHRSPVAPLPSPSHATTPRPLRPYSTARRPREAVGVGQP